MFVVPVTKSFEKNKEIVMKWMTREQSKINRIACPWLIQSLIDK